MELDLVSMVVGAVASRSAGDVTGLATAPVRALSESWRDKISRRLDRHTSEVDEITEGRGSRAPDRLQVKAAVEAALTDDDLTHRYLAGVVAGASDEDVGVPIVSRLGRLSSRDIRLHFVCYRELHRLMAGPAAPIANINSDDSVAGNFEMFLPFQEIQQAMDLGDPPEGHLDLLESLRVLMDERLLAPLGGHGMRYGPPLEGARVGSANELTQYVNREIPDAGLVIRPTTGGMALLASAAGRGGRHPADFRALTEGDFPNPPSPPPGCPSAVLVTSLPRT